MIEFKIRDHPNQRFATILGGRRVSLNLWYSSVSERWNVDLSIDGDPVLHGRKIVEGIDILRQFNFGIGAIFSFGGSADRQSLVDGSVKLYHATQEEIDAAVAS